MKQRISHRSRRCCIGIAAALSLTIGLVGFPTRTETASAASTDYPVQLLQIQTADRSKNLNITGYSDNAALNTWATNGEQNENWRFDAVGVNSTGRYYRLVNMGTGRLLTPQGGKTTAGTNCVIYGSEDAASQYWYVTPVSKDGNGTEQFYKITHYQAPELALTNDADTISLRAYTGADNQKWLLNTAGLQGFAGSAKEMNGKWKAANIGGGLGETVEVTTFSELKAACTAQGAKTIVITKNISGKTGSQNYQISEGYDGGKRYICKDNYIYLQPNKTIVGSYAAHTLHNVYFRTYDTNYGPGHDIILRNITCTHDTELNSDNIWEFAYGWNFWIDHCNMEGHAQIETSSLQSDDWDKFLNFKGTTDLITISDCTFGHHEYGVLLGYPADDEATYKTYNNKPCTTLANNAYSNTITRAPGLMRYGYFHSLNNYVNTFSMGYTVHTACKLFAENCYYENGGNVVCDWNKITYPGSFADSGSKAVKANRTNIGQGTANNPSYATKCTWRPASNYSYKAMTADEAKAYCTAHSGAQSTAAAMTYATFAKQGVPTADFLVKPDASTQTPERLGDVNADGTKDRADAIMLQAFLMRQGSVTDADAADMNQDGELNAVDLTLLKRLLSSGQAQQQGNAYEAANFVPSGKVYLVGDSTVCDYDSNINQTLNRYGWGQKLAAQFSGVTVQNLALSGRSSRSFLVEKNYQTLCNSIGKGDYLFIQFGHNDEKTDEGQYPGLGTFPALDFNTLDSSGKNASGQYSFEWMLLNKYVKIAQSKGAQPVLVTPITRRGSDGTANDRQHTPYQNAIKSLGAANNLPVIDMTALTVKLYTDLYNAGGADETAKMHCNTSDGGIDNTHLSSAGADKIARMIVAECKKLELSITKAFPVL